MLETIFGFIFPIISICIVSCSIYVLWSSARSKKKTAKGLQQTALQPGKWKAYPLVDKKEVTHDTHLYRFGLPNNNTCLGLPIGNHLCIRAKIENKMIYRNYTPVSLSTQTGHFDLIIKTYEKGNISKYLDQLNIGSHVDMTGPKGTFFYRPNMAQQIGLIAGGTGITPMLQIIRAVCFNPEDKTQLFLISANVTCSDIILKSELDSLASMYPQFSVYYVLNEPPEDWSGGRGFVSGKLIAEHCPAPGSNIKILVCGPPPMVTSVSHLCEELGYEASTSPSHSEDMVFLF